MYSLQRCLGVDVDVEAVRRNLKEEFSVRCGVACAPHGLTCQGDCMKVYDENYLNTDHWEAVIRLIGRHSSAGASSPFNGADFCVRVIELTWDSSGIVLGHPAAPRHLTIAREHGNHFVPVLPCNYPAQGKVWSSW